MPGAIARKNFVLPRCKLCLLRGVLQAIAARNDYIIDCSGLTLLGTERIRILICAQLDVSVPAG